MEKDVDLIRKRSLSKIIQTNHASRVAKVISLLGPPLARIPQTE